MRKKTKIVATISDRNCSYKLIKDLFDNGMNVVRLNTAHQDFEGSLKVIKDIRKVSDKIAILVDTKGPEIRTNSFKDGKATIIKGSTVTVHMDEIIGDESGFSITYPKLYSDMKVNEIILIDDGYLSLTVKEIDLEKKLLITEADNTHTIKNRRGINVPGVNLQLDFISEKDKSDIIWACKNNVDFIAASFVRRASDVLEIRQILKENNSERIKIISK